MKPEDRDRILIVCGTRPEIIKIAPVHAALEATDGLDTRLCATSQHTDMAEQTFRAFGLLPDTTLPPRPTTGPPSLTGLTSQLQTSLESVITEVGPRLVVVQGDTASAFAGAFAAFSLGVPVAHVEAGLRSFDLREPFPEEGYRTMIAQIASLHFAPTPRAARNLDGAGVDPAHVFVTGNTATDAALELSARLTGWPEALAPLPDDAPLVLVTAHRRESWGAPLESICRAVATLHEKLPDVRFLFPVHPNPRVRDTAERVLSSLDRVDLVDPLNYEQFIPVLRRARMVMTDSGGIQEEAPTFGVPTLVLRDVTERPEAVEAGLARLVGTDHDTIVEHALQLMRDEGVRTAMSRASNPFGDGQAGRRIARAVKRFVTGAVPYLEPGELFVPDTLPSADAIVEPWRRRA